MDWLKEHKKTIIALGLIAYAVISFIFVALSYEWIKDLRPIVIISDVVTFIIGVLTLIPGEW
jgi:hypothetical protein